MDENKSIQIDLKINELEITNSALDRNIDEMLEEYQVTDEKLTQFVTNPENFSNDNWQTLQTEKKRIDSKLQRDLDNIVKPAEKKKRQKERNVPQHWLFVR